jgi:hypothetical protein
MDPSTILQQTSELSQMQAVQTMTGAISSEQGATEATQADGLIGMQVSATVDGSAVTGTVSAVALSASGEPTLNVAGTAVPLSAVTEVTPAGTDPTTGLATGTTTSTGTGTTTDTTSGNTTDSGSSSTGDTTSGSTSTS